MDELILQAKTREVMKKKTRFLRRQGITPTHVFGHGIESLALEVETPALQRMISQAGMTRLINLKIDDKKTPRSVFIRVIQRHPTTRQVLHVDFYEVKKGEKIECEVPIVFVGKAPILKEKGHVLTRGIAALTLECLPGNIPPQIEVDLSPLTAPDSAIYVKDIALSKDITVKSNPDQLLIKVTEEYIEKVEEVKPAAEAEAVPGAEAKAEGEAGAKAEAPATEKAEKSEKSKGEKPRKE